MSALRPVSASAARRVARLVSGAAFSSTVREYRACSHSGALSFSSSSTTLSVPVLDSRGLPAESEI